MCRLPHSRFTEMVKTSLPCIKTFALDWDVEEIQPIFAYIGKDKEAHAHIHWAKTETMTFLLSGDLELAMSGKRQ